MLKKILDSQDLCKLGYHKTEDIVMEVYGRYPKLYPIEPVVCRCKKCGKIFAKELFEHKYIDLKREVEHEYGLREFYVNKFMEECKHEAKERLNNES